MKVYISGSISDGGEIVAMVDCRSSVVTSMVVVFGVHFSMVGARVCVSTIDDDVVLSVECFVRVKGSDEGGDII